MDSTSAGHPGRVQAALDLELTRTYVRTMEVSRGGTARPWPAPTSYQDMQDPGHRAVYIHLPDGLVTGELMKWLFSREHG